MVAVSCQRNYKQIQLTEMHLMFLLLQRFILNLH